MPLARRLSWSSWLSLAWLLLMACISSVAAASGAGNEMGDLVGLTARVDGRSWEATLTRDVMGREVDRQLPGGGRSYIWRDALGRPTQQFVGQGETAHRLRRLSWSFDERLMSLFEPGRGETKFSYDGRGYLSKVEHPDGRETLRLPDETGNLFGTPDGSDREYTRAGAVVRRRGAEGETVYRYDEEGNLSERRDSDGGVWRYHFRGDGKLRQVDRPDGTAVAFKYDALGGRVEKNWAGKVTRFAWAGDVVLHEWTCSGEAPQVQRSREEQSRYQAVERLRAQLHGHFGEDEGERKGSEDPVHLAFLRGLEEQHSRAQPRPDLVPPKYRFSALGAHQARVVAAEVPVFGTSSGTSSRRSDLWPLKYRSWVLRSRQAAARPRQRR